MSRVLEGKPVLARPVSRLAKAWRWCHRNPRLATAVGSTVLSLLLGLAGVLWQWRSAETERTRAEAGEQLAHQNAYAADMNLVQRALKENDGGLAADLLNRYRPAPKSEISKRPLQMDPRDWEWRYYWSRCQSDERFTLCQYSNSVAALALSSDGKWLAVRLEGGTVALWDAKAKRPLVQMPGAGGAKALAFSPKRNLLAWGGEDSHGAPLTCLFDVDSRKEIARLAHSASVLSLAFSPDGQELAGLGQDGTVHVHNLESQRVETNFTNSMIGYTHYGCVAFSHDGRWLAMGGAEPRIRLWERATGKETVLAPPISPETAGVTAVAFSPDDKMLAAGFGYWDHDVHVWNLEAGTERRLARHDHWVAGLCFSPDGKMLASASADQSICLWDLARNAEHARFHGNTHEVWAICWSPDGKDLLSGGRDGSVRYWDPWSKPAAATQALLPVRVNPGGLAFGADGRTLFTANQKDGAVSKWDAAAVREVEKLAFLGTNHSTLALSPDERWMVVDGGVGEIQVWNFKSRVLTTNLMFHGTTVFGAQFSDRGKILICPGFSSGRIVAKFWAVAGWRELAVPGFDYKRIAEGTLSPNERTLAIGYTDGTVDWWDLASGQKLAFFACRYRSPEQHIAFSPDGKLFASAGGEGQITLWDVATRQVTCATRGNRNAIHALAFSPPGRRLASGGGSAKDALKLWDVATGRDVASLAGEVYFLRVGFSPDGNTLFAITQSGKVLLWHAPSFAEIESAEKKRAELTARPASQLLH